MENTVVLYPAPGMGHVISMVKLGNLILHRSRRQLSIKILLTTGMLDSPAISSYIQTTSRENPFISFVRLPAVAADFSRRRGFPAVVFEFIALNASAVRAALKEISRTSSVRALVIDFFCTSAFGIARELGVPVYYFCTSGAAIVSFFLHFPVIHKQFAASFKDLADTLLDAPGLPPIRAADMPEPLLDRDDPAYGDILHYCEYLTKADGILINTFYEFEPKVLGVISSGACIPNGSTPPVYCVGPLVADSREQQAHDANDDGGDRSTKQDEILSWLDAQPKRSVVFLCFGSMGTFSAEQLKEIALGLERSGYRFLWVVKSPPQDGKDNKVANADFNVEDLLGRSFLERTRGRGMVVKAWAPQVVVLSHGSVGGFVTHCGWNSVLEAVVAGVPMVAWPLYAEQHMNREVMVREMGMAIGVERRCDRDGGLVSAAELERRLHELMDSEQGKELRERSLKMREMAEGAWGEFGSSSVALANVIEVWNRTVQEK